MFSLPFSFQPRLTLKMESCILERRHAFHQGPVERAYMTYNRLVSTVIVLAVYLHNRGHMEKGAKLTQRMTTA